jgi:Chaperone of endosialidase
MLIDGISLAPGSHVTNLVVATGSSFPASPDEGELFYRNDGANEGLYAYNGSGWEAVSSGGSSVTLTGDVTGTGTGSFSATLATVNSNTGSFGSSTSIPTFTVNGKGLITAASGNLVIAPAGTLTGTSLASNVVSSSLTSVGTLGSLSVSGDVSISGNVTGAAPTATTHLATKSYVDNLVQGLSWKNAVRVATTGNITLSGTQIVDSVTLAAGDRILVKDQSTGSSNGLYVVASGAWARAVDFDGAPDIGEVNGAAVYVTDGTTNGDTTWTQTATITSVGSQAMVFAQLSGSAGAASASTLTGTTLAANVVNSSLTTVGTITSGVWSGTAIDETKGGTGFTSYTIGDTLYASSTTALAKLAAGASGTALLSSGPGSAPFWGSPVAQASTLTGTTLASNVVNSSLTAVGTLGTGIWNANTITAPYGGTGHAAYAVGDVLYANTSTSLARLAAGAATLVLTSNGAGTAPTWQAAAAAAGSLTGTTLASNVIYSSIQRLGTIDTGTWEGTAVAGNYGGTGQSVYAIGDLLYANSTLTLAKLAAGTAGNVLVTNGAGLAPSWGGVPASTLTGTTLASNIVSSSLTTFGTITSGVWSGTAIAANKGGTGQTGFAVGDILYAGTLSTLSRLPAGTNNYVLTSNGANTAPSWQIATSATLANATILGDTVGAVTLTGIASSGSSPMTIAAGVGTTPNSLTLSGSAASGGNSGGDLILKSGTATAAGSISGSVTIHADGSSSAKGGALTIRAGDSGGNGVNGTAGSLSLSAGSNTNGSTGGTPGNVTISAGNAVITQPGGSVTISAGTSAAGGGDIVLNTGATSSLTERFRITKSGAWSVGTGGAAYGTSGQVLTSNGNAAPTWQTSSGADASTLTGTTLASNIVSSSLTSVGTIVTGTWNGTAIAAVNGGTGQTTYTTGDLLYASSGSALSKLAASTSGLVLTSNGAGTAPTWQAVAGGAASTLTGTTLASNVVSSSLTSVGTLTGLSVTGLSTITRTNATALRLLSNGSTAYTNLSLGRTTEEIYLGVVGQADNFITTAAVGDFAINSGNSGAILFGINGTKAGTFTNTGFQGAVGATTKNFGGFTDIDVYSTTATPINFKGSTTGVEGVLYSDANIFGMFDTAVNNGFSIRTSVPKASIWTGNVERVIVDSTGISTGVWNATAIGPTKGGTNQTSYATGDILYASGTDTIAKRTIGSTGQVLTVVGGVPAWSAAGAGSVTSVSVTTANGVSGSVATATSTPAITLTLGAITPSSVVATGAVSATTTITGSNLTTTTLNVGGGTLGAGFITVPNSTGSAAVISDLTISAGGGNPGVTVAGDLILQGGTYTGAGGTSAAGDVIIRGGDNNGSSPSGTTGNITLSAGGGTSILGGSVIFATVTGATGTTKANRMVILANTGHIEAGTDNTQTFGTSAKRWSTVYAGTPSINTSDENLKEQITSLSVAELAVATAIKPMLKKFKFKDAVMLKGTGARWHVGIIAQDLAAAFAAQGLDADHYGMFCSDTWYELNGEIVPDYTEGATAVTRLGVRYEELLAFIISAL